jgi:nucleotide-binding universal stress UspA family protein
MRAACRRSGALDAPAAGNPMDTNHPNDRPFVLLAALDLTDTESGGYALEQALRVASRIPGAQMHVLHVSDGKPEQQTLELLRHYVIEKAASLPTVTLEGVGVHVRKGEPAHVIAEMASEINADLVIVGTHRIPQLRTVVKGHTGKRIERESTVPVLVAGPRPKPQPEHIIVIEGPCPDCLATRQSTGGRSWWCARHAEHHPVLRHHLYAYETELPFAQHDSGITPTGVD